jgi:hypothetical protein
MHVRLCSLTFPALIGRKVALREEHFVPLKEQPQTFVHSLMDSKVLVRADRSLLPFSDKLCHLVEMHKFYECFETILA